MNKHNYSPVANATAQHLQKIKEGAEAPKTMPPDIRQKLLHASGALTAIFMEPAETYDTHIIGATEVDGDTVVVYNKMGVIVALAKQEGIDFDRAIDQFEDNYSNVQAAKSADDSPRLPLFVVDVRDM